MACVGIVIGVWLVNKHGNHSIVPCLDLFIPICCLELIFQKNVLGQQAIITISNKSIIMTLQGGFSPLRNNCIGVICAW